MSVFVPTQVLLSGKTSASSKKKPSVPPCSSPSSLPAASEEKRQIKRSLDEELTRMTDSFVFQSPTCTVDLPNSQQEDIILHGDHANVFWRAVSMNDLREHPLFSALPNPADVEVRSVQDLCLFQQDSWQWDALHQGRLTTSRLASILGFFEKGSAAYLGIPTSLTGHERAISAWQHLRQKPPPNWNHLNNPVHDRLPSRRKWPSAELLWRPASGPADKCIFPFQYTPSPTTQLSSTAARRSRSCSASNIRMAWGSAQEATALLAVLNYFALTESAVRVCESGMCCFESLDVVVNSGSEHLASSSRSIYEETAYRMNHERSLPLLGASPDGLLRYADGLCEVIEIKCSSPFVTNNHNSSTLSISFKRPHNSGIPVWHIPQLQMEIFCAGPHCSGAVMAVLYADGAKLFRIERDDQYIAEMLSWVSYFFKTYHSGPSNRLKPPDVNFLQPKGNDAYRKFLDATERLAKSASLVVELSAHEIQRSPYNDNFFLE